MFGEQRVDFPGPKFPIPEIELSHAGPVCRKAFFESCARISFSIAIRSMALFSTINPDLPELASEYNLWRASRDNLSCPFFLPTERADDIAFPHPVRLPL